MKPFVHDDFLLESETARELYHGTAKDLPIIDYHCHLSPELMASDHRFRSITEIWLEGDHYKWRAMRANGIPESFCSGDASDFDKFEAWARTVPETLGNPLYHWTAMELRRPFGIEDTLGPATARDIFGRANEKLQQDGFTTMGLLAQFRVAVVCSTDDPVDSLEPHARLAARQDAKTQVYPTWRPDKAVMVEDVAAWTAWLEKLEAAASVSISTWESLLEALEKRHSFFHERGCRASDHGLERIEAQPGTDVEAAEMFARLRKGRALAAGEAFAFRATLLHRLAILDHARGWVQQFHFGAMRNNNTRMRRLIGPDTGFDSVGDFEQGRLLARFLDRLDENDQLAKTILYNLNPNDNELMATMAGNYQDGRTPGQDAVRLRLVVPRSARRDGGPDARARQHGPARALRRHDHRLAELPVVLAPRVLPPPALQHPGRGRAARPAAGRQEGAREPGGERELLQRADYFGFPLGSAAGEHARAPRRA
jgi:glucuronate isomerase